MKMSQGKFKTMPNKAFFFFGGGGVEAVYYGLVQVVNKKKPFLDNHVPRLVALSQ